MKNYMESSHGNTWFCEYCGMAMAYEGSICIPCDRLREQKNGQAALNAVKKKREEFERLPGITKFFRGEPDFLDIELEYDVDFYGR